MQPRLRPLEWIDGLPPPEHKRVLFRTDDHITILAFDPGEEGDGGPFWYVPGPGDDSYALASYTPHDLQDMADDYKVSFCPVPWPVATSNHNRRDNMFQRAIIETCILMAAIALGVATIVWVML